MPCYDDRNSPSNVYADAKREFTHNSPVAEYLCEALKLLTKHGLQSEVSPGLAQWWIDHQARDGNP